MNLTAFSAMFPVIGVQGRTVGFQAEGAAIIVPFVNWG